MERFRIDPEFENKIPPIGEDEFKQLEDNIVQAGEVYEALTVWKEEGILVDGHNRWKIIQKHPDIKYTVREMSFPDKWAAFEWMYRNQLGRRNLTDEQRTYTIGKMKEARKKSVGEHKGNQYTKMEIPQNGAIPKKEYGTAAAIAREIGVGRNTVDRAEKFAEGVDTIREVSEEAADKILAGMAPVTKTEVQEVTKMEPEQVKEFVRVITGNRPKPDKPKNPGRSKETRELMATINEALAPLTETDRPSTYDINDLVEEIEINGTAYAESLRRTIDNRKYLLTDRDMKNMVSAAVGKVMQSIVNVRGEFVA